MGGDDARPEAWAYNIYSAVAKHIYRRRSASIRRQSEEMGKSQQGDVRRFPADYSLKFCPNAIV
jgi:hypothetical protein